MSYGCCNKYPKFSDLKQHKISFFQLWRTEDLNPMDWQAVLGGPRRQSLSLPFPGFRGHLHLSAPGPLSIFEDSSVPCSCLSVTSPSIIMLPSLSVSPVSLV